MNEMHKTIWIPVFLLIVLSLPIYAINFAENRIAKITCDGNTTDEYGNMSMTNFGTTFTGSGRFEGCDFEADDSDYLENATNVGDKAVGDYFKGVGNFSMVALVKFESFGATSAILSIGSNSNGDAVEVQLLTTGKVTAFVFSDNATASTYDQNQVGLVAGKDYCLALTWDNETAMNVTINASDLVRTTVMYEAITMGAIKPLGVEDNVTIGAILRGGAPAAFLDGIIKEYHLYTGTLDLPTLNNLCVNGTDGGGPDITPPVITFNYPTNGTTYTINYTGEINITVTDITTNIGNCTINNTGWTFNQSEGSGLSVNFTFFNASRRDGKYVITLTCNDTAGNSKSEAITFFIDTINPTITLNSNNEFNSINLSQNNQYDDIFQLNITFADETDLHAYQINVTREATTYINRTDNTISGTSFTFNETFNISNWGKGIYNISVWVSDSHTLSKIEDYEVTISNKLLQFDTTEDIRISIYSDDDATTRTTKEKDRYSLEFDFTDKLTIDRTFHVVSNYPLSYKPRSGFKAHFVVMNGMKGNWIDFEGVTQKPTITRINEFHYTVSFTNLETKVTFTSIGGLNVVNTNFTWYRGHTNQSFDTGKLVTETMNFSINVTNSSVFIRDVTARFFYNGNEFSVTKTNRTDLFSFSANTSITTITGSSQTFTFTWNMTVIQANGSNYTFGTSRQNTVNDFTIGLCNATVSTPSINFTFIDELNSTSLNTTLDATFVIWVATRSNNRTRTFTPTGRNFTFEFCITPENATINADYDLTYSATDYQERRFIVNNALLTKTAQEVVLTLLRIVDGIFARFRTIDTFQNIITNVDVQQQKILNGTLQTIANRITDASGIATFFVNPDDTYTYTFVKTGFTTITNSLRVTSTDLINIVMGTGGEVLNASIGSGLNFVFIPSNTILGNNTEVTFGFNITSSFWNISNCTLFLRNGSNVILLQNTTSFNSRSCNITITTGTGTNTTLISQATVQLSNFQNVSFTMFYSVRDITVGQFSLKTVIDDISALSTAGFNNFTRMFLSFLIIFGIVGFAATKTPLTDIDALLILTFVLIVFFSFTGWLTMNYPGIPSNFTNLSKYLIAYISFFFTAGIIMLRNK